MTTKPDIPVAAIYGNPVSHSLSPIIHTTWGKSLKIQSIYIKRHCKDNEDFSNQVRKDIAQGFCGGNVTIPFKQKAYEISDECDEVAKKLKAVNLIVYQDKKILGSNTDAYGYEQSLNEKFGKDWAKSRTHKSALVIGAGGASRAILYVLIKSGFKTIYLANRTQSKISELENDFNHPLITIEMANINMCLKDTSIIINTTSLGMKDMPELKIDLKNCEPDTLISDIIYKPEKTALLKQAETLNLPHINGLGMLIHQAVPAFEKFFNHKPQNIEVIEKMFKET